MISPEVLRRYPFFATVSDETLKAVAMTAEEQVIPAGRELLHEGEPATSLSIITKGEVDIQYILGNGERRTVDTLVDGDLLGWSALVEPHKITANCIARKETRLVAIQGEKLRALCAADPNLGYHLLTEVAKLLAHRLEGARVQLAAID